MINLDWITNENNKEHNEKWPYIPDHPYRILIICGSESAKTNPLIKFNKWSKWYWQNVFVCKRFMPTKVYIFD